MSGEPVSQRAAGHVAAFNQRVRSGGTGSMTIRWSGGLIAELTVTFD